MNYPAASSGVSKTPTLKADFAASGGELTPKEIKRQINKASCGAQFSTQHEANVARNPYRTCDVKN